jgi:hypothetical protein
VPRVLRLQRLGHKRKDIDDFYAHVTPAMREKMLTALQQRWEHSGGQGCRRGGWDGSSSDTRSHSESGTRSLTTTGSVAELAASPQQTPRSL